MNARLRIGHSHGYRSYREVEPVPAYPRIDPQQPRDEYPRQQSEPRQSGEDLARRRFTAMRRVIDLLKKDAQIDRVDYQTADAELTENGFRYAEEHLVERLLELPLAVAAIDELLSQIRQRPQNVSLQLGDRLSAASDWLPVAVNGLRRYCLRFGELRLAEGCPNPRIMEQLRDTGHYRSEAERCTVTLQALPGEPRDRTLSLSVEILVAAAESDENGRRVLLYPRPGGRFALYADKQIDLSI